MAMPDWSGLEILCPRADVTAARIVVRMPPPEGSAPRSWRLSGEIVGPVCDFARTMPVNVQLRPPADDANSGHIAATATLTEPCFWTPELPFLYYAHLQLHTAAQQESPAAQLRRPLGLLPLSIRKRRFYLNSETWVPRAISADTSYVAADLLDEYRQLGAVLLVTNPDDAFCDAASHRGIPLIAQVPAAGDEFWPAIRRLARWPAVALLVIGDSLPVGDGSPGEEAIRHAAAGKLLGLRVQAGAANALPPLPPWADVIVCHGRDAAEIEPIAAQSILPTIAVCQAETPLSPADARARCDALQQALAHVGLLAGYGVG